LGWFSGLVFNGFLGGFNRKLVGVLGICPDVSSAPLQPPLCN